jgi:hypothetical protein
MLHQHLKELIMLQDKKPAKSKVAFNKFFPTENSFVNVEGAFRDASDWFVDLTLQTGLRESTQLWVSDYKPQESLKQLRSLVEAANKAIDFAEKCIAEAALKPAAIKKKK